ncbi:nitrilase-related carbon-nitrogen hydrolase [Frondihabitans australicus]|uniref:Putative amidohydrolase n=1 Tax=Frondihabitans australicus TaxID=386892 RepID=A0A495IKZ7_9MICO|nr:nitrilase-related carbon-nitrogen hydrolase [Frondihabitans australicus]RKR76400.1 putative amidohydrolase [Frondihabitans australicus]
MSRIAVAQVAPDVTDQAGNLVRAAAAITTALDAGADIVVLPELVTSGYVFESADEARAAAIPADAAVFDEWTLLASTRPGAVIVGGFAELGDDGNVYNSAAMVDGSGVRAVYRKVHLWDEEPKFFTAGSETPPVVSTSHGTLGMMICYDLEFPEWTRLAALAGTEILLVPTNWPFAPRPAGERVAEVQTGAAAARINRMAVACADRTGTERGVDWNNGSSIISAAGWVVAEVGEGTGIAYADIDAADSRSKAWTERADAFADRRPELYGGVARP